MKPPPRLKLGLRNLALFADSGAIPVASVLAYFSLIFDRTVAVIVQQPKHE